MGEEIERPGDDIVDQRLADKNLGGVAGLIFP